MASLSSIITQIHSLIIKGNHKMGRTDTNLTDSYEALLNGYNVTDGVATSAKEFTFKLQARSNTNSGEVCTKYAHANCIDLDVSQYSLIEITLDSTNADYYYLKMNDKTITTSAMFDITDQQTLEFNVYGTKSGEGASTINITYSIKLTP